MLSAIGSLSAQTLSLNKSTNSQSKQAVSGISTLSQTTTEPSSNEVNSATYGDGLTSIFGEPKQTLAQQDINLKDLHISQGQALTTEHLKLETTDESKASTLNTPTQIKQEVPRAWKLPTETMKNFLASHNEAIDSSGKMNLSYDERKAYIQNAKNEWVEDKRQNDPEMFAAWLKLNKDKIFNGQLEEVGLPSNFTLDDYHSYVKESISIWA